MKTTLSWSDRTLDNPAENHPAGQSLESFVQRLRKTPPARRQTLTLLDVAQRVRRHFGLKPPISDGAIKRLLREAGIHLEEKQRDKLFNTPEFIYNRLEKRWEIYYFLGKSFGRSRDLMHEFWEILFWRCYHCIPWWKEWATMKMSRKPSMFKPHDASDDFAYYLLLSCGEFRCQAHQSCYNLWTLSRRFGVTKNLCFRAMNSFMAFPFPMFHAILILDTTPRQFTLDSFLMQNSRHAVVKQHALIDEKESLREESRSDLNQEEKDSWDAVKYFHKRFSFDQEIIISCDDAVYGKDGNGDGPCWQATCVAGVNTLAPVSVIVRPAFRDRNIVYVQVVPVGEEEIFLPQDEFVGDDAWALDADFDSYYFNDVGLTIPQLL